MGKSVRIASLDWPQVVADIRREGLMVKAIARHAGIAPSTVGSLISGAVPEPVYSVGVKLLELRDRVKA